MTSRCSTDMPKITKTAVLPSHRAPLRTNRLAKITTGEQERGELDPDDRAE